MLENITVNAQSSIRIAADKVIYFDPFRIENAAGDADIIFITHEHFDHFSPDDISKAASDNTIFVIPAAMKDTALDAGLPSDRLVTLYPDSKTEVCTIPVEAVPAYNLSKQFHPESSGWLGYIITVSGQRIYVSGDTDATPEAKAVSCDTAMIPIGGTYTMDHREAAALINEIKPKAVIPTHYGSIVGNKSDGEAFSKLVESSTAVIFKL